MAKPPNPPRRRRPPKAAPERRRSNAGRIAGAVIAVGSVASVGLGIKTSEHAPPPAAAAACGGTERWSVKVANDADAATIAPNPLAITVAEMNALLPGPVGPGGRMEAEKRQYTVEGYLAYFKHEEDGDYHAVITDEAGTYAKQKQTPTGHSVVVEFPNTDCFSGKSGKGPKTSPLGLAQAEARAAFEEKTGHLNGAHIPPKSVPVVVTGVAFFDFDHGQTGRASPHLLVDANGHSLAHQAKVVELHPVTAISFVNDPEID